MDRETILGRIKDAYERRNSHAEDKAEASKLLAELIREASESGISYLEIAQSLGMSKTGVSSILNRAK